MITDYLPKFAMRNKDGLWHRMDNEKPMADKRIALGRKKELGEIKCATGFRIVKHQNRYYLYEKKH